MNKIDRESLSFEENTNKQANILAIQGTEGFIECLDILSLFCEIDTSTSGLELCMFFLELYVCFVLFSHFERKEK